MTVAALFQRGGGPGDQREDGQVGDQRGRQAPALTSEVGASAGSADHQPKLAVAMTEPTMKNSSVTTMRVLPPPTANSVPGAAAAQLHADAEQEGAQQHRHARRRDEAGHRLAEQRALRQHGEEQQHAQAQHEHLRAQAGATAVGDEHAPGLGEAEGRVIQRHAQQRADDP